MSKKLERLLTKEKQIKAQIQQAQAAERTQERKRDTRRKILVGTAILSQVDNGKFSQEDLMSLMDEFLTRSIERELFGLTTTEVVQPVEKLKEKTPVAEAKSPAKKKRTARGKAKSTTKKASA